MTDEQGGELHALGLRSLMAKSAVLDMGTKRLIIPGDGGLRVQASPGIIVLPLQVSESGHLILPRTTRQSGIFTMGCRQTRDERRSRSRSARRRDRREASPSVEEPEREGWPRPSAAKERRLETASFSNLVFAQANLIPHKLI